MVEVQICEVDALPDHSTLLNNGLGLFSIVEFPWLFHITSSADVTMKNKA
jgi:hypothetical protein